MTTYHIYTDEREVEVEVHGSLDLLPGERILAVRREGGGEITAAEKRWFLKTVAGVEWTTG